MKEISYRFKENKPYGIHDKIVNDIRVTEDSVIFNFENGLYSLDGSDNSVMGNIEMRGVDFDFAVVNIMSRFGFFGNYRGNKMSLNEFVEKYSEFSFEITDELHSYNQVWFSGYLSVPKSKVQREMQISIYYNGEKVYQIEE